MTDKLIMGGVNLTDMGIGDVEPIDTSFIPRKLAEDMLLQILGSITFGPVTSTPIDPKDFHQYMFGDPEDEDDGEWEYAE